MENINLNIEDYTINDLLKLFELKESFTLIDLDRVISTYIDNTENNSDIFKFLIDAKDKLKEYRAIKDAPVKGDILHDNAFLPMANSKIAEQYPQRKNMTQLINDNHMVLGKQRLPVGQGYSVEVLQGELNPTQQNINEKIINVNSSFRDTGEISSFTINFSEVITNVLSISLYSIEIPLSYYVFDISYGTTSFYISDNNNTNFTNINITSGNYTESQLITEIQSKLTALSQGWNITYNTASRKTEIYHTAGSTKRVHFSKIDSSNNVLNDNNFNLTRNNNSLGYLLGFRNNTYDVETSSQKKIISEGLVDTYGPKYLQLIIDDFKQNRCNNTIVNIYDSHQKVKKPIIDCDNSGNLPLWKQFVNTQNTINVNQNLQKKYYGNSLSDVIAKIPITKSSNTLTNYVELSSSLEKNSRSYFGPINLERLKVILVNDQGFELNLNNMEYSFSLICKTLYQY
jgi:hypothetical protein